MSNNDDILIKLFRKRVKDYELPVEQDIWASIEKDLPPSIQPFRRKQTVWMWSGIAASILLLLSLGLFLLPEKKATTIAIVQKETNTKDRPETKELQAFSNPQPEKDVVTNQQILIQQKKASPKVSASSADPDVNVSDKPEDKNKNKDIAVPQGQKEEVKEEIKEKKAERESRKLIPDMAENKDSDLWHSPSKKKTRKIAYALALGNSGSAPEMKNGEPTPVMYNSPSYSSEVGSPKYTNLLGENIKNKWDNQNPVEYKYKLPVSVSFSIRKYLTDNWAVETGLSYTYLSTNETYSTIRGELQEKDIDLHYLGIPLKGIYSFFNTDRLSAYVAAGTMLEKNIYGQTKTINNQQMSVDEINVPELQWSVFGNIGINYKLFDHLGLFIEPGVSYYFDDKSDVMTIRKDSPTNFNLQVGIRLTY